MCAFPACIPVQANMYPWRPEKSVGFPGTGVEDGGQLPCESWELSPDPLLRISNAFFFFFFFLVFETGFFLCSPGCPGTHFVTQKSTRLCLPNAGIKGVCHHAQRSNALNL